MPTPVDEQLFAAIGALRMSFHEAEILAIYLYGSAVGRGLMPDSDLDLFVLVDRPLTRDEKRSTVEALAPISRQDTRPSSWRPLEVTVVSLLDVNPWRYPPRLDFQYGEWLTRDQLLTEGLVSSESPDLAVVLAMVWDSGRALEGPEPRHLLAEVPAGDLRRAMTDELPVLLDDLDDDTRNVILTLARIWATLETGRIMSKADAADWAINRLPSPVTSPIAEARDLYLQGGYGSWDDRNTVSTAVKALLDRISPHISE